MHPILATVGNFNVYAFGVFLALAFLLSTFIVWKNARENLVEEEFLDAFLFTNIAALISARVIYIFMHFDEFGLNILKYIVVRETPGLSLLGGLFGGFIFLFWYARVKKYEFLKLLDLFSVAGCFALILAKIGEQLGGAEFGRVTTFLMGVKIAGATGFRHPVELYEAVALTILSVLLFIIYGRAKKNIYAAGTTALVFGFGLSLILFLLEFFKEYTVYLYGLSIRQFALLIIIIVTGILLIRKIRLKKI